MLRLKELQDPTSCINRASDWEMVFVLLARDKAAAWAVRFWCLLRVLLRKNKWKDEQIQNALGCARTMDAQRSVNLHPWATAAMLGSEFGRISTIELHPNDLVVVSAEQAMSIETAERIKKVVQGFVPGYKVLVLGDGLQVRTVRMIVDKPDERTL